jgi:hypothetical protein
MREEWYLVIKRKLSLESQQDAKLTLDITLPLFSKT